MKSPSPWKPLSCFRCGQCIHLYHPIPGDQSWRLRFCRQDKQVYMLKRLSSRSLHRCRIISLFMVTILFGYWFHFEQRIPIGSVKSCHLLSLCLWFITILTVHRPIRATYPHTSHFNIHLDQLSSWRRIQHITLNVERNIILCGYNNPEDHCYNQIYSESMYM
jgi:hypothetical protein